jgi:glycosyltransferase involved in cell wall biosynthesis
MTGITGISGIPDVPMTDPSPVHVVLPGEVDDPTMPSGGNTYDRRVCHGLAAAGRPVHEIAVPGTWPRPGTAARAKLARSLAALPDGSVVLLDGLVACGVPDVVVPQARRLALAVLVHLPLADETGLAPESAEALNARERETLHAASAVVATSAWAARRLIDHHGLVASRVHVVAPGTDPAPLASGTGGASRLLCVASVTARKGQDLLIEALAAVADLPWHCVCVGPPGRDPAYAAALRHLIGRAGLGDRVRLAGPRTGERLAGAYAAADLVVLASRAETYGMVVTEALARGIPVLATAVGGVPQALGQAPDGGVPGILVPPEDPAALAAALRRWFGEPELRRRLRISARHRRRMLQPWQETSRRMAAVLEQLRGEPG